MRSCSYALLSSYWVFIVIAFAFLIQTTQCFIYNRRVSTHRIRFDTDMSIDSDRHNSDRDVDERRREKMSFKKTLTQMFFISAPLGTLLDNQHGLFNVLNYNDISYPITVTAFNEITVLKTASFVPLLFGSAGVIMTSIVLFLDKYLPANSIGKRFEFEKKLTWPSVFYGISVFSFQYYLSGYLDHIHADEISINIFLNIIAITSFLYYDSSTAGLIVSLATAIAGPLAEIFLVNVLHLYSYTNGNFFGVCSWIYSVYFCGGYAVSNLSRKLYRINTVDDNSNNNYDNIEKTT